MDDRAPSGFTLIELVTAMAMLAIMITWAVPAFADLVDGQRLRAAAYQLAADLRQARGEAIARHAAQPVGVAFRTGTAWCYGVSQQLPCDCRQTDWRAADACLLDASRQRQLRRETHRSHPHVMLAAARFSGGTLTVFDPLRGTAQAGTVALVSARGKRLEIRVSTLGRVRICAPADVPAPAGFQPC